jgi:hypothetical protein
MSYPKYVFKNIGPIDRANGTYDQKLVTTEAEYNEALAVTGWFPSLTEAINGQSNAIETNPVGQDSTQDESLTLDSSLISAVGQKVNDEPPTREEFIEKAKELGLKFQANISTEKLAKLVDDNLPKD